MFITKISIKATMREITSDLLTYGSAKLSGFGADQGAEARAGAALRSAGEPGKARLMRGGGRLGKKVTGCGVVTASPRTLPALAALTAAAALAQAQSWPAKPVRLVVSQAAGGAPDIIARVVAERLGRAWGQQVVVENRPGGANVIAAQYVARSAPDGYTLFFATAAALVTNPYTFKSLPYDPARDFTPIGLIGKTPFIILAHPSVPAKTLRELIALDKSQPGKLTLGSDGARNFSGMVIAWLNKLAGTSILQVPYTSMPQGIQDTLAGHSQLIILAPAVAAQHIKRGALRPLAVTWAQRVPGMEELPPVADLYPGFDLVGWFVIVAPSGTPAEIIQRANRDLDQALKDTDVKQRLRNMGVYTDGAETPEAAAEFVRRELANWGRVVKAIGIEPE
jgi:tripartite-type tricarboxylate transporter receptor subunit TctC